MQNLNTYIERHQDRHFKDSREHTRMYWIRNNKLYFFIMYLPHSPVCLTLVLSLFSQESFLSWQWLVYVLPSVEQTGSCVLGHRSGHWQWARPSPKGTQVAPQRQKVFSHGSVTNDSLWDSIAMYKIMHFSYVQHTEYK